MSIGAANNEVITTYKDGFSSRQRFKSLALAKQFACRKTRLMDLGLIDWASASSVRIASVEVISG